MKRVYTNSNDVIHLFAQRTQDEARCSNVFFYDRDNIYSYGSHYLLANFIDADTIMINDDGYSVTTSKHINQISYATRQYKQFFKSETNLDRVHSAVMDNKESLGNACKPELYILPILDLFDKLNEYLVYSKAKRYKSDSRYREIKNIVNALNDNSEGFKEKIRLATIKKNKADIRKARKLLKEKLRDFQDYVINSFRVGKEDFVRLSQDGQKVETSQGISIERGNAKTLYELIKRKVDIKGRRIENYTVISSNGTLKIGCHNINMESVHKIGKLL